MSKKSKSEKKFNSKGGFILASVGAAVGLGNALRFPGLCAKFGGGTYLFIYLIALLFMGVPLLNAELALGRKFGGGAPKCMGLLRRGGGKLGWTSCVNSVFTAIIYAGLAGWMIYMIYGIVPIAATPDLTQAEIGGNFFGEVLNARQDGVISSISLPVCLTVVCAWVLIFFCIKGGAGTIARAAKFTVIAPVVLLAFMAGRGLMYDNSGEALTALFAPDLSALSNPELWLSALGQVFFSLSVAVGIMPAYGAYLPEKTNIFSCSLIIAASDFFVSMLASVVLFTTLYGCGLKGAVGESGIITAFVVYPSAICRLFGANATLNAIVGALFYTSLALIAVQAATSMLEAFISPFSQTFGYSRSKVSAVFCTVGAIISLVFATSCAPTAVDLSDRFINFYNILFLCAAECIIIGRSKKLPELTDEINAFCHRVKMPQKMLAASVKILSPITLIALTAFEAVRLITNGLQFPLWAQLLFGWGLSCAVLTLGLLTERRSRTVKAAGERKLKFIKFFCRK